MARPSSVQSRNLSLTEELEKLEQSITLTLQEIDHNFSKAHRIVTTNILPIVENYAKHSEAVWEGSKFWKQFFEASANVSLSGYEETAEEDYTGFDETVTTATDESHAGQPASTSKKTTTDDSISTADERPVSRFEDSSYDTSSAPTTPTATIKDQGSPRKADEVASNAEHSFADYDSPYESLKREFDNAQQGPSKQGKSQNRPTTPSRPAAADRTPGTRPSPMLQTGQRHARRPDLQPSKPDPLLHHVLDKTYRIQATPHTQRKRAATEASGSTQRNKAGAGPGKASSRPALLDSSPFSPDLPAPQLRSEIFGSPSRGRRAGAAVGPRTPGVSVQKNRTLRAAASADDLSSARKALFTDEATRARHDDMITWDSDDDDNTGFDNFGMSPPKTMQFHIPQSRLLQTPAREASKRIVEDLLLTAGAASVTSTMQSMDLEARQRGTAPSFDEMDAGRDDWGLDDDSPSVVRVKRQVEDEITF